MRSLPKTCAVAAPLLVLLSLGCQASSDGAHPGSSSGGNGGGGTLSLGGGVALPPGTQAAALLPARIRRLADAEYQASVTALVPAGAQEISKDFIPDSRQSGFTLNEAQRVDPVFAGQLAAAATTLAAAVRKNLPDSAICANPMTEADACADRFIRTFGAEAYRRPLGDDEVAQLMIVFHAAFQGGSYEEGVELTVRAMLQSAAFLYLTEIGDAPASTIKLTPYELASSISYLIQGRPPSAPLKQMAVDGMLDTPEGRAAATTDDKLKLFVLDDQASNAQTRAVMVVKEWLGTDTISEIAKDTNIYPEFAAAKGALGDETTQFVAGIVSAEGSGGGSLAELLAGGWSMVNTELAKVYGVSAPGTQDQTFVRVDLPNRLGILNQGAFLSVFAHAHETAPVLRGVAVMRRVACAEVGDPVGLTTAVVPPAPDPNKTTRERFVVHGSGTGCAGCHNQIDSFGFAFEGFDGMGQTRPMDNGKPVDSNVVIAGTDFDGSYADSNALVKSMSTSKQVRDCFARHIYRALATTSAPEFKPSEDDFVKYWATTLEPDGSGMLDAKIVGTLTAFLTNPSFAYRRAQ